MIFWLPAYLHLIFFLIFFLTHSLSLSLLIELIFQIREGMKHWMKLTHESFVHRERERERKKKKKKREKNHFEFEKYSVLFTFCWFVLQSGEVQFWVGWKLEKEEEWVREKESSEFYNQVLFFLVFLWEGRRELLSSWVGSFLPSFFLSFSLFLFLSLFFSFFLSFFLVYSSFLNTGHHRTGVNPRWVFLPFWCFLCLFFFLSFNLYRKWEGERKERERKVGETWNRED